MVCASEKKYVKSGKDQCRVLLCKALVFSCYWNGVNSNLLARVENDQQK